MKLFRVKICGVTSVADALAVAEAGADALGLNFYSQSSRFVRDDIASEIAAALPETVAKVGVFVNSSAQEIREKVEKHGLDYVQLHGDEPPKLVSELAGLPVIRAVREGPEGVKYLVALVPPEKHFIRLPSAILLDAHSQAAYGGTGKTVAWDQVPPLRQRLYGLPLILAGGLTAENVAEAIRIAQPDAVDTASGVESSPGVKDAGKIRAFVNAAKEAMSNRSG